MKIIVFTIFLFLPILVNAQQIHMWKDSSGVMHFTDSPTYKQDTKQHDVKILHEYVRKPPEGVVDEPSTSTEERPSDGVSTPAISTAEGQSNKTVKDAGITPTIIKSGDTNPVIIKNTKSTKVVRNRMQNAHSQKFNSQPSVGSFPPVPNPVTIELPRTFNSIPPARSVSPVFNFVYKKPLRKFNPRPPAGPVPPFFNPVPKEPPRLFNSRPPAGPVPPIFNPVPKEPPRLFNSKPPAGPVPPVFDDLFRSTRRSAIRR